MQLNLDLFDDPEPPPTTAAVTWEQIDEAARLEAIEILARLISRMLRDESATEANDD